jgi:hypothetical protein
MDLLGCFRRPPVNRDTVRDELTRVDPEFTRVRQIQHDAISALAAQRGARDLTVRDAFNEKLRESWRPPHRDV